MVSRKCILHFMYLYMYLYMDFLSAINYLPEFIWIELNWIELTSHGYEMAIWRKRVHLQAFPLTHFNLFLKKFQFLWETCVWGWQNVLTVLMRLVGYPYNNELVIYKDNPDYLHMYNRISEQLDSRLKHNTMTYWPMLTTALALGLVSFGDSRDGLWWRNGLNC